VSVERLAPEVRTLLREAIAQARGREVSFTAALDAQGQIVRARVLARGTIESVLALPGAAARGEILLHNHPSGVLEPSGADLAVAARLHDAGVGFGIVDNEVTDVYVVVEVPRARAVNRLDPWAVAGMLDHDGPVARVLGGVGGTFEDRPGQRDMAAHVADAYNDGGVAALEAGTGIGKSFAYLVPALEWAAANGERTVVSTNTINLQEQLVGKDLPLLARALADGERVPSFALLKGWRNYLCLARLEQARAGQESLFETGRASELDMLDAWASRTADGSLSDLATEPSPDVWDAVAAESDLCPRLKCPHFERCFLFQARRRAAEADVVVVNHHLLASDLAVRLAADNWIEAAVLPPYRRLIVDEAHHLEDVAAQHLGAQVSALGVQRLLGRFERNGRGLLPTLAAELALHDDAASHASLDLVHKSLLDALRAARQSAETLFALLDQRLGEARGDTPVLRLGDAFKDDVVWTQGLDVALDNLLTSFGRLRDGIETIADRMGGEDLSDRRAQLIGELRGVVRRLDAASIGLVATLSPPPGGSPTVRWLERRGRRPPHVALASVPLDLAPLLRETLWDRVDTAILTSATLAPGGEFTFLESRLGLDLPPARQGVREVLDSPFDYATQCLFGIPTDLPEPREDAAHDQAVAEAVVAMAQMADGGMFVLFTSHAALRRAAQAVRGRLDPRWPLLVQGDAPRDKLLRRFREAGSAILLGTDSFWEGVDVPGRALRALILAKLPFKVPSEPLTAARLERLEARGVDGFTHYLVPHAALKLKQGFGRLIRTRADVGAVVLLDRRAVVKPYGRALLAGLPRAARVVGSWADVLDACGALFAREAASREYVEG
jgi:ATP-dependent DNA helicase DinG